MLVMLNHMQKKKPSIYTNTGPEQLEGLKIWVIQTGFASNSAKTPLPPIVLPAVKNEKNGFIPARPASKASMGAALCLKTPFFRG